MRLPWAVEASRFCPGGDERRNFRASPLSIFPQEDFPRSKVPSCGLVTYYPVNVIYTRKWRDTTRREDETESRRQVRYQTEFGNEPSAKSLRFDCVGVFLRATLCVCAGCRGLALGLALFAFHREMSLVLDVL